MFDSDAIRIRILHVRAPPALVLSISIQSKEDTMNRRSTLTMATTSLMFLAVGLSASASLAQQRSLKEKLIGTWMLVSSDQVRPDGSKVQQFGADPQGINVFDPNGH